ncbi:hypothetical protein Tco_1387819, partial [Tanacetum coccineum]
KPDGSSYYTPYRLQWRNNMVNGTNTAASKFWGSKIAVSIQWDHRKARSEENSSSPIDSSHNAKIPGLMWDTHSPEQQDNPTKMYNGLWTRSTTF